MASALLRPFRRRAEPLSLDPETGGNLLATTESSALTLSPDVDTLFTFDRLSGKVRIFSISTGNCLRTYRFSMSIFQKIISLEADLFAVGISHHPLTKDPSFLTVRRISRGRELIRFEFSKGGPSAFASLGNSRFLTGTKGGEVVKMQWSEDSNIEENSTVKACPTEITCISVSGDRFAVCSVYAALVAVFKVNTFQRVGAMRAVSPCCIHFADAILAVGCVFGKVLVYDTVSFDLLCDRQIHSAKVLSVYVMSNSRCILSSSEDGSFHIQDVTTGAPLWKKTFTGVHDSVPLPDGRLVIAFTNRVVVYSIPQEIQQLMSPPRTPLRDALESCVTGKDAPAEMCKELITSERCRSSFDEWCCAHHLLMMAIEDDEIPRSRHFNGENSWWFENLYIVAKDVEMGSDDEIRAMKRFLEEAKAAGVVESAESTLGAVRVTRDVMREVRALKRADILMLERVLQIEWRLDKLKESFERYRRYMRNSDLLGMALQIIPIAGGSVAGIVSAGAEVLEGLSAKDLTDYLLGFGCNQVLDEVSSMSERVFSRAAAALSPEMLKKMNAVYKEKLEEAVECCGLSVSELRALFIEREKNARVGIGQRAMGSSTGAPGVTIVTVVEEAEDEVQTPMLEMGSGDNVVDDAAKIADETGAEGSAGKSRPSAWVNFSFGGEEIKELSQKEVASLWAAFIVRNDDKRQEEYEELEECLHSVLREEKLYADLIVDSSAVPSEQLVQLVIDKMQESGIRVAMGVSAMMKQVLCRIQREA